MQINREDAKTIVEMAQACESEGVGPNFSDLLLRIGQTFGPFETNFEELDKLLNPSYPVKED